MSTAPSTSFNDFCSSHQSPGSSPADTMVLAKTSSSVRTVSTKNISKKKKAKQIADTKRANQRAKVTPPSTAPLTTNNSTSSITSTEVVTHAKVLPTTSVTSPAVNNTTAPCPPLGSKSGIGNILKRKVTEVETQPDLEDHGRCKCKAMKRARGISYNESTPSPVKDAGRIAKKGHKCSI